MADRFDKFTERARRVLTLAHEEALRFNHNYIGTEHLLLGLIRERDGMAAHILVNLGIELGKVRSAVEFIIGRGDRPTVAEIGLTPRGKKIIELAVDEARRLKHRYIGTEHLLLGMVREGKGIAAGVLESLGVNLERTRAETAHLLAALPEASPGDEQALPAAEPPSVQPDVESDPPDGVGTGHALSVEVIRLRSRFDRFTERARRVIELATEESRRLNHNYIGTEHLLLGLVREGDGVAAKVLANLGVMLGSVRSQVEFIVGRGDRAVLGEIGLTPRAKKVIELAVDEARRLNHHYIGTEHLLLGLIREGEGIAAGVLESLGVNLERVRAETTRILSSNLPQGQQPPPASPIKRSLRTALAAVVAAKNAAISQQDLELAATLREMELNLIEVLERQDRGEDT